MGIYNDISKRGRVPISLTKAVTVLVKIKGDPLDPANQRPISLLNSDYKILAKYINEVFLQDSLPNIISPEQLCAVRGRSIQDGLILVRDLINY